MPGAARAPGELMPVIATTDLPLAAGRYRFPSHSHNPPDGTEVPDYLWHQWTDPPLLYLQYRSPGEDPTQVAVIWPSCGWRWMMIKLLVAL